MTKKPQHGVFLLEALIAILIFSLGILGMVAMGSTAIAAQSDAQYRTEAANYASDIVSAITLDMDRTTYNAATLGNYAHHNVSGGYCAFAGAASTQPAVVNWVNRVTGVTDPKLGLPGATAATVQVAVGTLNQVTVNICWQPPSNAALPFAPMHQHTLITYINGP